MLQQFTKLPPSSNNYDNTEAEDDTEGVNKQARICRHGTKQGKNGDKRVLMKAHKHFTGMSMAQR